MAMDLGTLVAKVDVDDGEFDKKTSSWSQRGAAVASAFGNLAANAISSTASVLADYVGEAMVASDATDKFKKTLSFAGLDDSAIATLTASVQAYADQTVYSLSDIQNITAQLTANSIPGADGLAMALGNLNAIAGGNAETFGRVGMVLTQTAGAGKLTTENWNQLAEAIPGASGSLMNALLQAGAYTGNFRDAMAKGEITAEEFNAALLKVGTDPIAVEAAKSTTTFEGAAGNLSATIQSRLVQALDMIKGPLTDFQNGLAWLVDNLDDFTPLLAGVGAAILVGLAPAIWAAVTATAAWTVALLANPMTWIILGVVALVAAIVWLIQNWDTAVAWITDAWGGFIDWVTSVIDGFVGWWNGIWSAVGAWITDVWNGFTDWIKSVWDGFITWVVQIVVGYLSFWINTWTQVGTFITDVWNGFVGFIQSVWNGFIDWIMGVLIGYVGFWLGIWNSVRDGAVNVWTGIIAWFQGIPAAIKGVFDGAVGWLYDIGRNVVQGFWDGLKSIWESVSGWFQSTFGGVVDMVAGIFGIHSPSRVFHGFGVNIGQGLIDGLAAMGPGVQDAFIDLNTVPTDTGLFSGRFAGAGSSSVDNTRNITVQMFEPQHPDASEQVIEALGSPRIAA